MIPLLAEEVAPVFQGHMKILMPYSDSVNAFDRVDSVLVNAVTALLP
jgi:hypothetical protein